MDEHPQIAVLILNWKNIDATVQCIESVSRSQDVIPEVYLLDNETNEQAFKDLRKALRSFDLNINLFSSYQNLGFAGGMNYLVNQVNLVNFSGVFLLNNDAKIAEDTLKTLLKECLEKDIHMLGPKTESSQTGPSCMWPWWLFGLRFPHEYDESNQVWPTFYVSGSGLYITKSLVNKIMDQRKNLFNSDYFLYCEDTELGLQARNIGFKSYVTSRAKIKHQIGSYESEQRRMLTYYYITRNRIFLARNYLSIYLKPIFHIYYLLSRFLIIGFRLTKRENKLVYGIIEGLKDGYLGKIGQWEEHPIRNT